MLTRKKTVKLEIRGDKVREQLAVLIASMEGFLIQRVDDSMPSDLLIMEISDDTAQDFDYLNRAKAAGKARDFFITSKSTNPDVLIQALRMGVKEFIPQPVNEAEFRKALLRFRDGSETAAAVSKGPQRKGRIIDLLGVKGGVGTTTIAVNLADSLVRLEGKLSVAIIDMNRLFGEIPLFFEPRARLQLGGRLEEHRPPRCNIPDGNPLPAPLGAARSAVARSCGRQLHGDAAGDRISAEAHAADV